MGFRDREKQRQNNLGHEFFEGDSFGGINRKKSRSFCLEDRKKNVFTSYRSAAIEYFRRRQIPWHDGGKEINNHDLPSNHLCCSQSCCVNLNFPFMNDREGLRRFLQYIGYSVEEVLPIELDQYNDESLNNYIGFEWIGQKDYLNELRGKDAQRTRGKYATSADFIIRFRQENQKVRVVLGEWKYTEFYTKDKCMRYSQRGTDRLGIYRPVLQADDCQIILNHEEHEDLFYDPFDQLMRLQLLATEMEKHCEMKADIVSTIHIVPKANKEFNTKITSPKLAKYGETVHEIWGKVVSPDRFKGLYLEDILPQYCESYQHEDVKKYIQKRYGSMK